MDYKTLDMSCIFRVVVHSRFHQDENLFHDNIYIPFEGGDSIPPQELLVYCDTGDSLTDFVYHPMVLCGSGRPSKGLDDASVVVREQRGVRGKCAAKRRRTNNEDYVDPHDENPTFMCVTEPRRKSDVSCSIPSAKENDAKSVVEEEEASDGDAKGVEENVL